MTHSKTSKDVKYLHGFTPQEQQRLREQAEFAEQTVYRDVNFNDAKNILEVGCGVGAQSEILLRRFPKIHLTGIDLNETQLDAAKKHLAQQPHLNERYELKKMNAQQMEFGSNQFDGAFLCFVLEHVPNPTQVLSEVRRVLKPGAVVYVTEVMNHSFFLDPYSPNLWKYWMAFNDYQYDHGGDPFIGAKLGNLLTQVGFKSIQTTILPWFLDNRQPEKRREVIEFWNNLLLSARENLIESKYITEEIADGAVKELLAVRTDPNAVFFFTFMQAKAIVMNY